MVRRLTGPALVLLVSALVHAGEAREVTGTVKAVSGSEFTLRSGEKDMTFAVDSKATRVVARGATHKMDHLKANGKPAVLSEFLSANQTVSVRYYEKDGRRVATKVHVRRP